MTDTINADAVEKYKQAIQMRDEAIKQAEGVAKQAFGEMAKGLFEKHPKIKSFSWTQYTPYFNDGDECVFRVYSDYPAVVTHGQVDDEEGKYGELIGDEYFIDDISFWSKDEEKIKEYKEKNPILYPFYKDMQEFLGMFKNDLRSLFGDHVKVTVSADGVDVQDYEHD